MTPAYLPPLRTSTQPPTIPFYTYVNFHSPDILGARIERGELPPFFFLDNRKLYFDV